MAGLVSNVDLALFFFFFTLALSLFLGALLVRGEEES